MADARRRPQLGAERLFGLLGPNGELVDLPAVGGVEGQPVSVPAAVPVPGPLDLGGLPAGAGYGRAGGPASALEIVTALRATASAADAVGRWTVRLMIIRDFILLSAIVVQCSCASGGT
ncbi:hypothetical protein ACFQ2B_30150 [Streptomyces stramineus]